MSFSINENSQCVPDILPITFQPHGDDSDFGPFISATKKVAAELAVPPSWLLAVMSFETAGTFRPDIRNGLLTKEGRTNAPVGLVQFSEPVATELETTTAELSQMSREAQLEYVQKYFQLQMKRQKIAAINNLAQLYLLVLYPAAAKETADHVVFRDGTRSYELNHGAFGSRASRDGQITIEEISSALAPHLKKANQLLRDYIRAEKQKSREADAARLF